MYHEQELQYFSDLIVE